jgi:glucosamine-phosphate N-acetyltransferase
VRKTFAARSLSHDEILIDDSSSIQDLTTVAHVEEVCVAKSQQGKGLGLQVIKALSATAEGLGVGKLILNCSAENAEFYKKCGYELAGQQMKLVYKSESQV